ncbi:MAG: 3-oxoacyl-ACP reductase [Odoribacter sp.]|nr:3-oxoacyl-ACP reductase [Odoribacter sp.]
MDQVFTLKNKTVLITGASSGLGRSIAIECSRAGAGLIITGRNSERLEITFSALTGGNHLRIMADLGSEVEIKKLADQLPQLNGIVHCAGINTKSPVKFLSEEKIDEIMKTNFYAPALLSQALLKQKKIQKLASIVMISSIASSYATVSNAAYASSKGALNSFVRVLALELAAQKIRVNGIQPGMVQTEILNAYDLQDELKESEKSYPLGRFGKPEDIAYAAIFLLSGAAEWITGTSLVIDGGITLR